MKQVALGLHNYHDTTQSFPYGTNLGVNVADPTYPVVSGAPQRYSWFHLIMPFVEQQPLGDQFKARMDAGQLIFGHSSGNVVVSTFMCPADDVGPKVGSPKASGQGFHGNYQPCHGSSHTGSGDMNAADGIFYTRSKTKIKDITDGTSKTVMVSEIRLQIDSQPGDGTGNVVCNATHDLRGRYHNVMHGNATFTTMRPPNTQVGDRLQYCIGTTRAPCRGCTSSNMETHARSWHPGGVIAAFADASVRFVGDGIEPIVFQAMGSRAKGEVVADD